MNIMEFMRDKKKKVLIYMVVLFGVLLLFIGSGTEKKEVEEIPLPQGKDTEVRLAEILEQIQGVGKVDVMIVYRDSGRKIYATDVRTSESSRESTAVIASENGKSSPFVVQEKEPSVQGVIIVADGGNAPLVQAKLKEATAAVLEVYPHKIAVYGREKEE